MDRDLQRRYRLASIHYMLKTLLWGSIAAGGRRPAGGLSRTLAHDSILRAATYRRQAKIEPDHTRAQILANLCHTWRAIYSSTSHLFGLRWRYVHRLLRKGQERGRQTSRSGCRPAFHGEGEPCLEFSTVQVTSRISPVTPGRSQRYVLVVGKLEASSGRAKKQHHMPIPRTRPLRFPASQ